MISFKQAQRLKKIFPMEAAEHTWLDEGNYGTIYPREMIDIGKNTYPAPSDKEMMDFLSKISNQTVMIESERTDDGLPYWNIWACVWDDKTECAHADLTECLVRAVEAVAKGAK